MTTTVEDTYGFHLARLDQDYIRERGRWVDGNFARAGDPVALTYEPGDGTSYALMFIAPRGCEQLGQRLVPEGLGDEYWNGWGDDALRWAVVAKVNCTDSDFVYPFDLTPGNQHIAHYVGAKIRGNMATATAITALFRAICGTDLDPNTNKEVQP